MRCSISPHVRVWITPPKILFRQKSTRQSDQLQDARSSGIHPEPKRLTNCPVTKMLLGYLPERSVRRYARIRENNIQLPFRPLDLGEGPVQLTKVRHVSLHAGDIFFDLPCRRGQFRRASSFWCTQRSSEHPTGADLAFLILVRLFSILGCASKSLSLQPILDVPEARSVLFMLCYYGFPRPLGRRCCGNFRQPALNEDSWQKRTRTKF